MQASSCFFLSYNYIKAHEKLGRCGCFRYQCYGYFDDYCAVQQITFEQNRSILEPRLEMYKLILTDIRIKKLYMLLMVSGYQWTPYKKFAATAGNAGS